ncbi:hypothetical protein [Candidatus Electrothrix sp.]|uniref:hypothetical protein n=1 Tax=Candidatus Electrothrix sp. TaxID=2170559 RepID=UPI00405687C6
MLQEKIKDTKQAGKSMLAMYSGEYIMLLFMCFFAVAFLFATFLFLTTGEEMIFVNDIQLPFLSSVLQ